MHPGMLYWWKQRRAQWASGGCGEAGAGAGCGPGGGWHGRHGHHGHGGDHGDEGVYDAPPRWQAAHDDAGGGFGVRRPLRFLAYKLELDEQQVAELAKVVSELKTERAQADVDQRRALQALADAIGAGAFDEGKAKEAGDIRVKSAERLRDAVVKALGRMHAVLSPEQRDKLAYLIRTGVVVI